MKKYENAEIEVILIAHTGDIITSSDTETPEF